MNRPSGAVTSRIESAKKAICNQPFRVMSVCFLELFRLEHRVRQVREQQDADNQSDDGVESHGAPRLLQVIAGLDVGKAEQEERDRGDDKNYIEHVDQLSLIHI